MAGNRVAFLLAVSAVLLGCGEREVRVELEAAEERADPDAGRGAPTADAGGSAVDTFPIPDGGAPDGGTDAATAEDGGGVPCCTVTFTQAVGGSMFANPDVYAEIPVHVKVEGVADSVTVDFGVSAAAAVWNPTTTTWVAKVPIKNFAEGPVVLTATAARAGAFPGYATAELMIGRSGLQLTVFAIDQAASSPRPHRHGEDVYVTWTDRALGRKEAWLAKLGGAGVWMSERVALVGGESDTLYARTAFGKNSIGVLFQRGGGQPYFNFFKTVDFAGNEIIPEMALDPDGASGNFYGDIEFDGDGFVMVWRTTDADGKSEVRWMRVAEEGGAVAGPTVVATSGNDDPIGGFEPFVFLDVAALGDLSMIGFARNRYDALLDARIPKSQLALVSRDGTLLWSEYAGIENDWTWHRECRVFAVEDSFVAVWSASDLEDPAENPPNLFFATRSGSDGSLDPARGRGTVMFNAPDDRDEPFLLPHSPGLGTVAWTDNRAYALNPQAGGIRLYTAPVTDDLTTGDHTVFPHARFIEGSSELRAVPAGTNALLFWLDERHGNGVLDPRPEVWTETYWQ